MSHYDIAVIGAGAAGLAAGLTLQSSGRSVIVLEARDRVGGRAFTDTETLGLPVDLGAHWLHAAAQNPFTAIADRLGFAYNSRISWSHVRRFRGGAPLPEAEEQEAMDAVVAALDAVGAAGAAGRDIAFADVIPRGGRWASLVRSVVGQITSFDPEDCSTLDYARYDEEGGDYPVENGYGALVKSNAKALAVTLSAPVSHVDWSGSGVRLEMPRGTLTARTIILAVPVNVLIAGGIRFTPALPARLADALHDCPMGVSEKVALLLDRPIDGLGHLYGDAVFSGPGEQRTFNLHVNPFGRPLLVSHVAGSNGRALEKLKDDEMLALATEAAVEAFGSSLRRRVVRMLRSHWASDLFTLGGYSHAKPGHAESRLAFSDTVGDRIVLAGEHCSIPFYSTVHGAHMSGIAAAGRALALLAA